MVKLGMVDYCFTHINDINVNFPVVSYLFGGDMFSRKVRTAEKLSIGYLRNGRACFFFCSGVAILQIHLIMIEPHVWSMFERQFLTMIVYRVPSLQSLLVEPQFRWQHPFRQLVLKSYRGRRKPELQLDIEGIGWTMNGGACRDILLVI
jgi:hypothetical protein